MKLCAVCSLPTPSLWQNLPVCTECRFLAKQYMKDHPTANIRQALIQTHEWIKEGINFALKKAEAEENNVVVIDNTI